MKRVLKISAVRNVQSDGTRIGRTFYSAVSAGDVDAVEPRDISGQFGKRPIAVGRIERHFRVDARDDLEQGPHGIDDLALRLGATARQIGHSGESEFDTFAAGSFKTAHALEHERGNRQEEQQRSGGRGC